MFSFFVTVLVVIQVIATVPAISNLTFLSYAYGIVSYRIAYHISYHLVSYLNCIIYHIAYRISYRWYLILIVWYHLYLILSYMVSFMVWYDILSYPIVLYRMVSYRMVSYGIVSYRIVSYPCQLTYCRYCTSVGQSLSDERNQQVVMIH